MQEAFVVLKNALNARLNGILPCAATTKCLRVIADRATPKHRPAILAMEAALEGLRVPLCTRHLLEEIRSALFQIIALMCPFDTEEVRSALADVTALQAEMQGKLEAVLAKMREEEALQDAMLDAMAEAIVYRLLFGHKSC
jgi:hypothetical protein